MIARVELPAGSPSTLPRRPPASWRSVMRPPAVRRAHIAGGRQRRANRGAVMLFAVDRRRFPCGPARRDGGGAADRRAIRASMCRGRRAACRGTCVGLCADGRDDVVSANCRRTSRQTADGSSRGLAPATASSPSPRNGSVRGLKSQIGPMKESMPFHVDRPLDFRFTIAASCWSLRAP